MIYARWIARDGRFAFSRTPNGGRGISEDYHAELIAAEAGGGKTLVQDASGLPVAVPCVDPPITREQVEASRLRAYAEPITGSDRYFAEAQRESLLGNAEAADAAKALGLARFAEIQAEYPWPAE
jgi:hypothetical protein